MTGARSASRRAAMDTAHEGVAAMYAIDFDALEQSGRSAGFIVRNRLCWQCQQLMDDLEVPIGEVREHMQRIADDCSRKADYLLPGTTLTEAIFRLLLAGNNRPMTIQELQEQLTAAWANVIYMKDLSEELLARLLDNENEYAIRRVK